jgi:hypothetical protein
MSTDSHPLIKHLRKVGEPVSGFAKRNKVSRTHLYRIINGENTTLELLDRLSLSTGGKVPVSAFLKHRERVQEDAR